MDTKSSGEDLILKTRKPYTITKQRERWTEEEHNKFLEALKLYGRAWQRIEDHVGTKTAVQIRSHAQKFFTKLEKEALVKGVPVRQAVDIEIPPPRPKRKPSNPYPRKTGFGAPTHQVGAKDGKHSTSVSSFIRCKQILDLQKEPLPEKPNVGQIPKLAEENQDMEDCSDTLTRFHEASCTSISSADKKLSTNMATGNSQPFTEYVPMMKRVSNKDETSEPRVAAEHNKNQMLVKLDSEMSVQDSGVSNPSKMGNPCRLHEKHVQGSSTDQPSQPLNFNSLSTNEMPGKQNYPRHVPVHVLDRSQGRSNQDISSDNYSICQISSSFSSLVISNLLQNPAAYAAACFAASLWPCANTEASANSVVANFGCFSSRPMDPAPSMAAVVAATVAAATAWWAAHGLLPLCSPIHPLGFTSNPVSATAAPSNGGKTTAANNERRENTTHELDQDNRKQHLASKSPMLSTSDSEEIEVPKVSDELTTANHEKAQVVSEMHDSNKTKSRKLADRSSCGSNTPSSSEVDPDALEEYKKDNEESKEPDASHPAGDFNNRRGRNAAGMIDSWKEVSEEGRLAFQALFSREVLPQSFYQPRGYEELRTNFENGKNTEKKGEDGLSLDLNHKTGETCSIHHGREEERTCQGLENNEFSSSRGQITGFKPYKRCSVEAKESRMVTTAIGKGEEKSSKRMRLERNASA